MTRRLSVEAFFDSLFITAAVEEDIGAIALGELSLFAYLACLLALFEGNPVADWGYDFVGVSAGAPFSDELDQEFRRQHLHLLLAEAAGRSRLTSSGRAELERLESMRTFGARQRYLRGAVSVLVSMPIGAIRGALEGEPGLATAVSLQVTRRLLGDSSPATEALHRQLHSLKEVVGRDVLDLMIPAITWLRFVQRDSSSMALIEE